MNRRELIVGLGTLSGAAALSPIASAHGTAFASRADLARFAGARFRCLSRPMPEEIAEAMQIIDRLCAGLDASGQPVAVAVEAAVRSDYDEDRWRRAGDIHVTATERSLQVWAYLSNAGR